MKITVSHSSAQEIPDYICPDCRGEMLSLNRGKDGIIRCVSCHVSQEAGR